MQIFIGNDHNVRLRGLKNADTGEYLNAATCTYKLCPAGTTTAVTSGTGTLSYVAGSRGFYAGTIESTVTAALTEGSDYDLIYTASEGTLNASWTLTFTAAKRK